MAKAKRQLIPETKTKNIKTYVSTSAIFKKSGSRQLIVPATKRESRYQAQYNHQSVNGIVPCSLKKHAKPPVHPLSTAFNGSNLPYMCVCCCMSICTDCHTRAHRTLSRTHPRQRRCSDGVSPPLSRGPPRKRQRPAGQIDQSRHSTQGRNASATR